MALEDQDPADELEAQRQRLANALRTGVVENPDALAADRAEAARRNMPVSRLRAIREVNGALPPVDYDTDLPERAPATSNFLSDPRNAAVAHDDIESLTGLERIVARGFYTPEQTRQLVDQTAARNAREQGQSAARTPLGRLIERQGPAGRATANIFRGIGEAGARLVGGVARVDQTLFGGVEDFARRQYDRVGIPIYDIRPDAQGRFRIQRVEPAADGTTRTTQMTRALETSAMGYEAGTTWEEVKARPLQNVIPFALESGLVSLPDMAAAVTVLPVYVVARTGGIGQSRATNDAREEATVGDLVAALPPAAASAFLERLGSMGILGVGEELASATVRGVASAAARGGLIEGVTEALQSGVEYAGTNLGTQAGFNPVDALDQMAAGAVAGTPFGATVRALTATGEVVAERYARDDAAAQAGEQASQTLGELAALAEASKLRERDPQTFQQFIEQASEGTPVENVYVEAQAFAQSLNDAGIPLEDVVAAIPALADQLPAALASGGDLRMTAGEFATHIAGTDAAAGLLSHLRTDPFGMSQAQAKDFMATRGEALQAEVETATAQAQATEELRAGRERVQTRITEELNTTGRFTKDVNAAYASLPSAFYDVMGARLGITAEQAAERYPLRFAADLPSSTGREVMDQQADTVDLVHFSDSESLTATDPSKWGASRATQNSERERRNAGAPGRTYFGVRGVYNGEPATGIARRPFQYQASVPASKLYDFDADPQGLKPTEGTPAEIATAYEKAIQAAGFSGYRSDAVVPGAVAVFDVVELMPAAPVSYNQTATVRSGKETLKKWGLDPNGRYTTRQVAAALEARQRAKWGSISKTDRSPEAAARIAKWMAEEVLFEMQNPEQSGVGWYSTKFQAAMDTFAQEFEELKTDQGARDLMTALIAITSDGQKVIPNFEQAAGIYRGFKKNGNFVADRGTQRQDHVDGNLAKVQELYDTYSAEGMRGVLLEEATVSELKKLAAKLGVQFSTSYQADTRLPMAAVIFGPKLGAFYANLMGAEGYLTMDRWWSRTFNRYRGTLLQAPTKEGLTRFRGLLGQPSLSDDETIAATVPYRNSYAAKNYKGGTEIEKAANTLYKAAFEDLEDHPFNASDRTFMLRVVADAKKSLSRRGVKISVADIQAVLWYYEKRLYGELGARQTQDVSYEEAAQRVVRNGIDRVLAAITGNRDVDGGRPAPEAGQDADQQTDPGAYVFAQSPLARDAFADFAPDNVADILSKDDWAILTAENPRGEQATPEENEVAQRKLTADLDALGVPYQAAVGRYGQIENSFVVLGITEAQATALGKKYDQDSVLTRKGLIYQDGSINPARGVQSHETRPDDFFTEVPGTGALFTVDVDFDQKIAQYNQSDPFYSALERAVVDSKTLKAPAAQWKATLAKTAGVKKEELEWSGVNDWLDAIQFEGTPEEQARALANNDAMVFRKITKDEVLAFLRAGGVRVEEVMLGGDVTKAAIQQRAEELLDEWENEYVETYEFDSAVYVDEIEADEDGEGGGWALMAEGQRIDSYVHSTEEAAQETADDYNQEAERESLRDFRRERRSDAEGQAASEFEDTSQFSSYKLPGADDTYREILLTLPNIEGPSTHWDTPNVVAHARFTSREDADGKRVLFLEELQSDWHQKGRDEGYKQDASPEQIAAAEQALVDARQTLAAAEQAVLPAAERIINERLDFFEKKMAELEAAGAKEWPDLRDVVDPKDRELAQEYRRVDRLLAVYQDLLNAVDPSSGERRNREAVRAAFDAPGWGPNVNLPMPTDEERNAAGARITATLRISEAEIALDAMRGGVADAPWKKSWDALLMKRMIRYAVDNGFEKVAWINGNQQNGGQTGGDGSFFYERNLVNTTNDLLKKYGARVGPLDFRSELERNKTQNMRQIIADLEAEDPSTERDRLLAEAEARLGRFVEASGREESKLGIQNGFEITPELAEAARQGFALFQRNRGQIAFGADVSQTPSVISLLRAADLSTFTHEGGHFFLEAAAHMANQPDAPADIVADFDTILNWFRPGMTRAEWNGMTAEQRRPFHEQWARGFEAYLFEGKAPSLALREQFRRFSAWLKNVYKSLTALDVELTDEVRQVMDRMLASEAEIAEMEQVRGLAPAFATKPEFASADEWEQYQKLGVEATAEAVEQLETRSARDMRWASGAKDRYVKSLQREAEEQRKTIRAEVTAEVMAEPVNRARAFLRRGLGENGEPVEGPTKLDLETLKALYPADGTWTKLRRGGKYGEVATDGLHPDIAASMFGYQNGEALIEDLVNGEDSADKIKGMTDQRMLERYGDLSSPQDIERAANEAVANDARGKFVAAEMAMADKAIGKKSILNSAAKEFAAGVVNRLELKRLRPAQYLAAQGRAAKAAEKALKADDLPGFATAKRNQLINLHTGRAVQQAQKDVEKTMRLFTRIVSAKDDSISKSRNMDLVNAARAILSSYGVGRVKNDPAGYMKALSQYDPTLYADIEPFVNGARGDAKPVVDLTYEQFQALRDTVNQLWVLSRRTKQIEIDGKLMDRAAVTEELGQRLEEIGIPDQAGLDRAPTDKDKIVRRLLGTRAALRRVESWARGTDGADRGPFRRFIWNPISAAADAYRAESGTYIRRFRALLDGMRAELKPGDIKAPEIGYVFGGKSELFHALLHTGNGSNKSKLLLGRGWGKKLEDGSLDDTRWQALIDRLHAEGVLTIKDWTFVQSVWDLLEETKPGAQRAHHAIYGRYFDEVSADPVDTPFGQLRGGYVPALTDAFLVQDAVLRAEQEAIEGGDSAMFPAASNGFTKSRVEDYTRELALDLRLLPMHIDKVLKFTHLGPPVRDVARLLKDRGFSKKLQAFDPTAQSDLLLPWLQRAAKQIVETPSKGEAGKAADNFFSAVRSRVGMQLMFANVVNTAQQLTGFSNVLLRVKAPILGDALWRYVRDPKGVSDAASSLSVFLTNRMNADIFEARQTITQLTKLNPSKKDEAVDFLQRHAYFMQSALQNVMDVVSWTAAYNQAVAQGENDRDAIRFADSVIRETQGTMAPEDISRFETGAPFVRMFTQFAGYFNMMANLNATEVQITARSVGLKRGMGRLFYVYLMGFAIPALVGDAIAKGLRGGWEDEEGDGYMDDLFAWFFSSQARFALAAVPVVGQAGNALIGTTTGAPYDDRLSLSPAVSVIESGLTFPAEAYQTLVEGESFNRSDVRNALNLLGVLTGTPVGALAKHVGYGVGVAQGDIEPTGPVDAARGVVTGAPSPESRQ